MQIKSHIKQGKPPKFRRFSFYGFCYAQNKLIANLFPALKGSSELVADVDLSLLGLEH